MMMIMMMMMMMLVDSINTQLLLEQTSVRYV